MLTLPAAATRFAGTTAVTCAVLTNVVASAELFHNTVDAGVKYAPLHRQRECPPRLPSPTPD